MKDLAMRVKGYSRLHGTIGQHELKIIVHEFLILFLGIIFAADPAA